MFTGATSFNSDLSIWNVSQGEKFVSFELDTSCFVSLCYKCTIALSNRFYISSLFVVYSNQCSFRMECFLIQTHSIRT